MVKAKRILSKLHFGKTLLTFFLAGVMFTASAWQWDRYHWKRALVDTYKLNSVTPALPFPAEALASDPTAVESIRYKKVALRGRFDYERQVIVLNRRDATGPGHHLITPFLLEGSNRAVLVSRGFIPFERREPETWTEWNFAQPGEIQAVAQKSITEGAIGPSNPEISAGGVFERKWLFEDAARMAQQLPYPVISSVFLQMLGGPPHGEFPKQAVQIQVPPSTHFGYTIEWAILGIITLALGIGLQIFRINPLSRFRQNGAPRRELYRQSLKHALVLFSFAALVPSAEATTKPELVPEQAGIDQKLDQQLDLNLVFSSNSGKTAPLKDFFLAGRPTIIVPVYYGCPRLCGMTLGGVVKMINELDFTLGKDYKLLAVSFDSEEGPALAAERAAEQISRLKSPESATAGWEFLTGTQPSINSLMSQLGFRFAPDDGEFSHAAGLMVLTPEGRISRYFFGVEFAPREMRYTLIEASRGRIGGIIDHVFLYCFRFDPTKGKYSLVVMNITRAVCALVVLVLAAVLVKLRLRENGSKGIS